MNLQTRLWGPILIVLLLSGSTALADTFSFSLNNTNISGITGPFASATVNRTSSTDATITFFSLTNSGNIFLMGGVGAVAVNVNASSWTLGAITGSNSGTGFTPGPFSNGGSGNQDGFGLFNQRISSFDGFTHSSDTISFGLTNTSGTWSSAAGVLAANSGGSFAAAHIFVTTSPANAANGASVTGFAANGPTTTTPEPSSLLLLGGGMASLLGLRRKRVREIGL